MAACDSLMTFIPCRRVQICTPSCRTALDLADHEHVSIPLMSRHVMYQLNSSWGTAVDCDFLQGRGYCCFYGRAHLLFCTPCSVHMLAIASSSESITA
jgi:hypothetical protein